MDKTNVYLVHFFKKWKYLDFCLAEFESLATMFGADLKTLYHVKNPKDKIDIKISPCVYVNLPSDECARKIVQRSVLIKEVLTVLS